jgi:hypothetical protein
LQLLLWLRLKLVVLRLAGLLAFQNYAARRARLLRGLLLLPCLVIVSRAAWIGRIACNLLSDVIAEALAVYR